MLKAFDMSNNINSLGCYLKLQLIRNIVETFYILFLRPISLRDQGKLWCLCTGQCKGDCPGRLFYRKFVKLSAELLKKGDGLAGAGSASPWPTTFLKVMPLRILAHTNWFDQCLWDLMVQPHHSLCCWLLPEILLAEKPQGRWAGDWTALLSSPANTGSYWYCSVVWSSCCRLCWGMLTVCQSYASC